ncbi:MAG: DNA-directed RNA polymerase subunit beta'' [Candidatus Caenarcaniphilales bacterium]|nr:DNA-directed RNA polymerase subunit beta'' [Candidatus Caenarcaniphilales bacterium]
MQNITDRPTSTKTIREKHIPTFVNQVVDKKRLSKLIANVYENFGNDVTSVLANNMKDLGFKYATQAAVTISIADLTIPPKKKELVSEAEAELAETSERFEKGQITEVERYNKVIDTWAETNEKVTEAVVEHFDRLNPVYMMAFSGARGNVSQVRQLVGMRGLMANSEGKIIDLPIKSNFKEGLTVSEYVISAFGARKGLVDTALKTADSGYLTRRLVDVAQDVIIRTEDCGTENYIEIKPLYDGEAEVVSIDVRLIGRRTAEDVVNPETGEVIVPKGEMIGRPESEQIKDAGIKCVKIRSVLTCEAKYGVCKKCYGWSTTDNKPVNLGEAIGIIAAQSIGEPGTQLTMRTFHTGGAVSGHGKTKELYHSPAAGTVEYEMDVRELRTKYGDVVYQTASAGVLKVGSKKLDLPTGASLYVQSGAEVIVEQVLGEAPDTSKKKILTERASKDVITMQSGRVVFKDFGIDETKDRQGNISKLANKQGTIWVEAGNVVSLPSGSKVCVEDGSHVNSGDTLSETTIKALHGGEIRYGADIVVEEAEIGSRKVNKLARGRLINVINASIGSSNAKLQQNQQGNMWNLDTEKYVLKVVNGESIESGKILAELVDDELTPLLPCSGEIRYDDLEIDDRKIVTKHGRIIFIPEEIHTLSKDSSLVMVESGTHVEAGTEVVKDVYANIDGIVRVTVENNIVHEVTITPGELYEIDDPTLLKYADGDIVKEGIEVMPGISTKHPSMITLFANEETGEAKLLLRDVQLFDITPREVDFTAETTDGSINILPVTQMNFRDGDKVRNFNGGALTKTSLILACEDQYAETKGVVEFEEEELNIIFQENIILRSERTASTITEILVAPGDFVDPGESVAKVQSIAQTSGQVFAAKNDKGRILILDDSATFTITTKNAPKLAIDDYVLKGDAIAGSEPLEEAGIVSEINGKEVLIRKARPFLVSPGTHLHVDDNSLVQQGDQLATIIYEKIKTGDIVQGLPKVEELLEGRKPKEPGILTDVGGKVEIVSEDGGESVFINTGEERKEFVIPVGQNIIVNEGDVLEMGDQLTDGQPNPHDLLEYKGVERLQQFLVDEVQSVYVSQGVEIANKHIETIVRQMTRKVRIDDPGDTELLQGELHDINYVRTINSEAEKEGKITASYKFVLLGLTKASLNTESFISAASFQETTRILAEAAIKGKTDWLHGLKENVIIGRLIPSGTGFDDEVDSEQSLIEAHPEKEELMAGISVAD